MTKTADWNSVPGEIVQLIADKSSTVEDLVALTCVSRYFRSSVQKDQWRPLDEVSQPPWLLVGCPAEKYSYNDERSALSMYTKKTFPMNQPKLHGRQFFGTNYGWILTTDVGFRLHLFNPLNQRRIPLPLTDLDGCHVFIERAIMIKRPPFGFDDFVFVARGHPGIRKFWVLRPENNTWETVLIERMEFIHDIDIAHYKGRIYVTDPYGSICIFSNLDGPGPLVEVEYVPHLLSAPTNYLYILESLGDLLLVAPCKKLNMKITSGFNVFKFNPQTKRLTAVEDLGDRSLFVGNSQSISLSAPESFNCRRNCIYFTDRDISPMALGNIDMGVFDLETRTIQSIFKDVHPLPRLSASTWFIPKLS